MQSIECPLCWIEAHIGNPNGENPGHPLKSKKIVKKPSKPVHRFRTPEGQHFRDEAAKLDNWLYHKRLTEYFKKDEDEPSNPGNPCKHGNPCNPGPTRYVRRGQTLPGRQMWLLEEMCLRAGIDTMMIDPTLTYWENKAEIERQEHAKLHLTEGGRRSEEARKMGSLLAEEKMEEAEAWASYKHARELAMGKNH